MTEDIDDAIINCLNTHTHGPPDRVCIRVQLDTHTRTLAHELNLFGGFTYYNE